MKTETLLMIAGAVGLGFYLAKKKAAATALATQAATQAVSTGPANAVPFLAETAPTDDNSGYIQSDVEYVPVPWGGSWGPSWGGWRGGGGGGHHGHHGMHGVPGRRRR